MANLKSFTTTNRWWHGMWGGGHTSHTDPTQRGWRAGLSCKGSRILIVGRPGRKGCFSVMEEGGGDLDVATYDELTPKEVADLLGQDKRVHADDYKRVRHTPGWILPFINCMEVCTDLECYTPEVSDLFFVK